MTDFPKPRPKNPWREPSLWYGAWIVVLAWGFVFILLGFDLFEHAVHDSYTLMAMAWRKGLLHLEQDYPWLELAVFNGEYYVSFPSVPALVMLPLTFLFGEETPNTLVTALYFLGSYFTAYHLCRRFRKPAESLFMALFAVMGCSIFDLSLTGDVWNQAQLLCFLLTLLCALGLTSRSPLQWGIGLFCLALSVGCRPFQAVYVPFGLWMLARNLQNQCPRTPLRLLVSALPYLIAPALVALALAGYNYARFGSILEFGHNYLPEFTRNPDQPQLGLQYVLPNLKGLLRLPHWENHRLEFPLFNGFAFYLANPIFVTAAVCAVIKGVCRRWDWGDTLLVFGFLAETFLLLIHKTFGGWQFGARYLCDLIPMMLLFELRGRRKNTPWEVLIGSFAIAFNLYGSIVFHLIDQGK